MMPMQNPVSFAGKLILRHAYDALDHGHGRDFRLDGFFSSPGWGESTQQPAGLRVFELSRRSKPRKVICMYSGMLRWRVVRLWIWLRRHHMRQLRPMADNNDASGWGWLSRFTRAIGYYMVHLEDSLAVNTTEQLAQPHPCVGCKDPADSMIYLGGSARSQRAAMGVREFPESVDPAEYRAGGFARKGTGGKPGEPATLTNISRSLSRAVRHISANYMQKDGIPSLSDLLSAPGPRSLQEARADVLRIFKGAGRNRKQRFDIGLMNDGLGADEIRAEYGHSLGIGVGGSALPVLEGVNSASHGATPKRGNIHHPNWAEQNGLFAHSLLGVFREGRERNSSLNET